MKKLLSLLIVLSCYSLVGMDSDSDSRPKNSLSHSLIIQHNQQLIALSYPHLSEDAQFLDSNGTYKPIKKFDGLMVALASFNITLENGVITKVNAQSLGNYLKNPVVQEKKELEEKLDKLTFWQKHPRFTTFTGMGIGMGIMAGLCWNGTFQDRVNWASELLNKLRN